MILRHSSIGSSTPKFLSWSWNRKAPMPYPAPRIVVLPTNRCCGVMSASRTSYMREAILTYTSCLLRKASVKSSCPANHANTLASICEESQSTSINPSWAMMLFFNTLPSGPRLGKFCMLILSAPPHRPVCAA